MGTYVERRKRKPEAPEGRVFERVHTRKLDRSVAHARMEKADLKHVNKHDYHTYQTMTGMTVQERMDSYFSSHWREVANQEMVDM